MSKLSHIDDKGQPSMVDIGDKQATARMAWARGIVLLDPVVWKELEEEGELRTKKGPVFQTAILAGIMGAKKTGELIPLCHPLGLDNCTVEISVNEDREIVIDCRASIFGKTGVEMEVLTGVSVAALTIYDMCKALSHNIEIRSIKLMQKTGGKRDFKRTDV